jgi:hypothetical protein
MGVFRKSVDGMPDVGQGDGYDRSSFTGRKRVKVSDLVSTNKGGYLRPDRHRGNGTVYAIEHDGQLYIADGHHTAAHNAGGSVVVRVKKAR